MPLYLCGLDDFFHHLFLVRDYEIFALVGGQSNMSRSYFGDVQGSDGYRVNVVVPSAR